MFASPPFDIFNAEPRIGPGRKNVNRRIFKSNSGKPSSYIKERYSRAAGKKVPICPGTPIMSKASRGIVDVYTPRKVKS